MQEAQVDLAALMECNVAWDQVNHSLYPEEQMKFQWKNYHWSISHNHEDPHSTLYQPRGTGIIVVNQSSHQAQCPGDNIVSLGK